MILCVIDIVCNVIEMGLYVVDMTDMIQFVVKILCNIVDTLVCVVDTALTCSWHEFYVPLKRYAQKLI